MSADATGVTTPWTLSQVRAFKTTWERALPTETRRPKVNNSEPVAEHSHHSHGFNTAFHERKCEDRAKNQRSSQSGRDDTPDPQAHAFLPTVAVEVVGVCNIVATVPPAGADVEVVFAPTRLKD